MNVTSFKIAALIGGIFFCSNLNGQIITKVGFGSCAHQNKQQPALSTAAKMDPDIFIFVGDNIYGDTKRMKVLKKKYKKLGKKDEFKELKATSQILATWDDHDYGVNDGGLEYPKKEESKKVFMDFWEVPKESPRWSHLGIYNSHIIDESGKKLQIILLDTRTFRTELLPSIRGQHRNDYRPNPEEAATILGTGQWQWLEAQLKIPADIRIIASSTQFSVGYNGYEAWANFPREQEKMLEFIKKVEANGVIFMSGDVHYAELSKIEKEGQYPIYDLTSSGITQTWGHVEANENRIGNAFRRNNFGMIEIDWNQSQPAVSLNIYDVEGKLQISKQIKLDELTF